MTTFKQKKDDADSPFLKLYYEILSRFHVHDYDTAISEMSFELRQTIEDCTKTITMTTLKTLTPDQKPDWATIPQNMNYVGIDQSGFIFLYEQRPKSKMKCYVSGAGALVLYGRFASAIPQEIYRIAQTLFERPGINNIKKPKNNKQ